MRFIFFSLRDFNKDVGENVRMYGMLNSLAEDGKNVTFISNAGNYDMFNPNIRHIYIGSGTIDKRKLQALTSWLPATIVHKIFNDFFQKVETAVKSIDPGNTPIYFFDYLDNTIGYLLQKKGIIKKYINDIHGIATVEFQSQIKNSSRLFEKGLSFFKYYSAYNLDKKVFENAYGFIYGSDTMRSYYNRLYQLKGKKSFVIPYVLGTEAADRTVNEGLKKSLSLSLNIQKDDYVFLFVGTYKATAGVEDLISAFDLLYKDNKVVKLILIGSGPAKDNCKLQASKLESAHNIIFIDSIPYNQLLTYQNIAHVIVCPDRDNPYSQSVIHVKYFDALLSGRLVINGSFKSVMELNKDEFLSLTFKPSDVFDLYLIMKKCVDNFDALMVKYANTRAYTIENLTYKRFLKSLIEYEM